MKLLRSKIKAVNDLTFFCLYPKYNITVTIEHRKDYSLHNHLKTVLHSLFLSRLIHPYQICYCEIPFNISFFPNLAPENARWRYIPVYGPEKALNLLGDLRAEGKKIFEKLDKMFYPPQGEVNLFRTDHLDDLNFVTRVELMKLLRGKIPQRRVYSFFLANHDSNVAQEYDVMAPSQEDAIDVIIRETTHPKILVRRIRKDEINGGEVFTIYNAWFSNWIPAPGTREVRQADIYFSESKLLRVVPE